MSVAIVAGKVSGVEELEELEELPALKASRWKRFHNCNAALRGEGNCVEEGGL